MGRIIIFTGKGGVGKSSIAAAHAVRFAKAGKRTLLVSADMAHNIGDIFESPVGGRIVPVSESLDALELDPDRLFREEYPGAADAIWELMGGSGFEDVDIHQDGFLPGFDNLFSLLKIAEIYRSGRYDVILVDCAPTAETLSLLKLPELLQWYIERFTPAGKMMIRVMSPMSRIKYHVKLPDEAAMDEIGKLLQELISLQELLKNRDVCSVRIVCIPEKMVLEETKRTFMYLNLYRYHVDGVLINRILPEEADNPFFRGWHQSQAECIEAYKAVFPHLAMTQIPWLPQEIRGREAVDRISRMLPEESVYKQISDEPGNEVFEEHDGSYVLKVYLPGAKTEDVNVSKEGSDLNLKVGVFKRCIPLPGILRNKDIVSVSGAEGQLQIFFGEEEQGGEQK